jgi:hypothetical protein
VKIEFLEPVRRDKFSAAWSRKVRVNGVEYYCSLSQGRHVRIAYKPRGQNIGHHWHGHVVRVGGGEIWSDRVSKSAGCKSMLEAALLVEFVDAVWGKGTHRREMTDAGWTTLRRVEMNVKYNETVGGL